MTNARRLLLMGVALVAASCSTIAPVKVNAGDQCIRCRRTIQGTRMAGELVYKGGLVEKFRAPGCMAKYLATYPATVATVFVTDFTSGKFVKASEATYVPVLVDPNTGETDYRAYKLRAEADAASRELQATAIDWNAVLQKARS
jgi:copper chaperone NosL